MSDNADHDLDDREDVKRLWLSPDDLVPNNWNPNEMGKKEYDLLKDRITKVGFVQSINAVEVSKDDGSKEYRIIGGQHRWKAAKDLGLRKIPVDVPSRDIWNDEDLQKFQTMSLQVLHGNINPEKFVKLYNEMIEKYNKDAVTKMMGYTKDDAIKKMVNQVSKGMEQSLPSEMQEEFKKKAKEAKTVSDLERIIRNMFDEYGDTMNYNYMVFSWGGKEHVYIAMSKKTRNAVNKIMKYSKSDEVDINELISDALESAAKSLEI